MNGLNRLNNASDILKEVYFSLALSELNKNNRIPRTAVVCCECRRPDRTLRNIGKGLYACNNCIEKRVAQLENTKKAKE